MAQVELKVVVDRSQLDQLQRGIKDLQKKIDIKVTSGEGGALKKTEGELNKIADATKKVTAANTEYKKALQSAANEGLQFVKAERQIDEQTNQVVRHINTFTNSLGRTKQFIFELNKESGKLEFVKSKDLFAVKGFAPYLQTISAKSKVFTANTGELVDMLQGVNREFKSARASAEVFAPYLGKLGNLMGTTADKGILGNGDKLKTYVQGLDGLEAATVRATGKIKLAGREFHSFSTEIDNGNGVMSRGKVYVDSLTGETYKLSKGFSEAKIKADELYNNIIKFARWYIIGSVFSKIMGGLRGALKEMKAVDTELITVRKVTDMTEVELRKLTDTAYDTAAALGATASAFLNAVSTFSKAGYDEQSEALGELAIMAANVGDTTQETANQFLLSVDKAYKYQGSIEALTAVLDGANEIGNQYATDVEHIASGLGLVAPVAAQAGVGIEELTAAIGTITAVTQRSGTESARALRALFLNILGDTKTEIDDGITWTADEIKGLHDLLNMYASDVVKAAQATGKVIDPMLAMEALAKSMKEGVLTESKVMEMVTDIGGKLRSSQLLALIQNWDMYKEMIDTYSTAAGSAAREYSIYLESWEAKTQRLNATWTKFVSDVVSSDAIKMALDGVIKLIDILDNEIVTTTISVAALSGAFLGLLRVWRFLKLGAFVKEMATAIKLFGTLPALVTAFDPVKLGIVAAVTALTALYKVMKAHDEALEKRKEKVSELAEKQAELEADGGEYETLKKKRTEELTTSEKARLEVLEATYETNKKLLAQARQDEFDEYKSKYNKTSSLNRFTVGYGDYENDTKALVGEYEKAQQLYRTGKESLLDYKSDLQKIIADQAETYNQLVEYKSLGMELTPEMEKHIEKYEIILKKLEAINKEAEKTGLIQKEITVQVLTIEGALNQLKEPYDLLKKAQQDMNELGIVSADTVQAISDKHAGLKKYLIATKDGYVLAKDALKLFLDAQIQEARVALGEAQTAAMALLGYEKDKTAAYNLTTEAIVEQLKARAALAEADLMDAKNAKSLGVQNAKRLGVDIGDFFSGAEGGGSKYIKAANDIAQLEENIANLKAAIATLGKESSKSGSGSSSKSEKDAELERLKAIVALRESELALMEKQGKSTGDQIDKIKEIQAALHNQAEYLRKSKDYLNGDAKALAEVNALSKQWLDYQQKIADLQKKLQDELEDAVNDKLKKAKDARDAEIKKIDEEIKRQKELKDNVEKQNELEEKINDVLEKRKALQNALNERNVRYYNAKTGQWEWGANAKNVADAKKDLEDAEDALTKYRKDLKYEAAIADLEKRKDAINQMYDDLEDEWGKITDSLQKPTRSIASILSDIAKNGTPEMKKQVENVSALLQKLGVYIGNVTGQQPVDLIGEVPAGQTVTNGGKTYTQLDYRGKITSADGKKLYEQLASGKVSTVTDSNGNTWEYAGNGVVRVYTDAGNTYLADVSGVSKSGSSGGSGGSSGGKSGGNSKPATTGMVGIDNKTYTKEERDIADRQGVDLGTARKMKEYMDRNPNGEKYDSGGILYGMGGIKATNENEMILPPSVTKQMLKPSANKDFQQRLSELKFMYGASKTVPSTLIANTGDGGIEKQYNGDIYQYGNVTLTREEAKHTSVYDLVQLSNKLSIYSKAN